VRLADIVLRRGHLSEEALAEICMTGDRPAHIDRCDACASRAVDLGRWLEEVRVAGLETADAAFPAERLAAQQTQIMRRLEQMDRPARVIAFPGQSRYGQLEGSGRGIRPAWVAVAAAAGLVLGVFGTELSTQMLAPKAPRTPPVVVEQPAVKGQVQTASLLPPPSLNYLDETDHAWVPAIETIDSMTPRTVPTTTHVVYRGGGGR